MNKVFYYQEIMNEDLGDGVSRKILSYDQKMMMVEVTFEEGAIGALHRHPHEQMTYVLEGSFKFSIENKDYIVNQGDSIYFQSEALHGTQCIKKGKLLDIFTPIRQDFL